MAVTAESENNGSNSKTHPNSNIEAVLSVPPLKVTDPRRVRKYYDSVPKNELIPKGCYQTVLYYQNTESEDRGGWFLAGWIRESLGRALLEEPILCGRVQSKKGENENDWYEIVSNDSGMRLYEGKIGMRLLEFLEKKEEMGIESEVVFWNQIDEENPQYSPLFYVQVTKFECGGYSIGISCSLLLADIMIIENFLKKWAEIHNNLLPQIQNEENKTPIFYHPILINEPPISSVTTPTPSKNGSPNTVLFKITSKKVNYNMELWKQLAILCVEEAEKLMVNKKKLMGSNFPLLVKESYDVIKVVECSKSNGNIDEEVLGLKGKIVSAKWNDFGDYDLAFHEGNKPIVVSNWIGSVSNGHVIVFPCQEENVSAVIIVSFPH